MCKGRCGRSLQPCWGVWGHAPPEKFSILDALRVNLVHLETPNDIQIAWIT